MTDAPHQPLAKRDKRALTLIALVAIVTFFGGLGLASYAAINYKYERAYNGIEKPVDFTVPKGAGLSSIAQRLESENLIDSAFVFKLVTKLRGNEANFKAGEFRIAGGQSMAAVYDDLASGKAILYPVTSAEGLTSAMIARSLDGVETFWRRLGVRAPKSIVRAKTHPVTPERLLSISIAAQEIADKRAAGAALLPNYLDKSSNPHAP